MTHAGFWVDGAVRKPEARHGDSWEYVVIKLKEDSGTEIVPFNEKRDWREAYWLDTTPRESLTPEELLSVAKVLSPSATRVEKRNDGPFTFWIVDDEESAVKVDWGNLTQYPPPVEPQWIRVTRENVGQYLFRECRFLDSDKNSRIGKVSGWDVTDDCCLVHSDYHPDIAVLQWNIVEVQNAPAS